MELLSGGVLITNNIMSDFLAKSKGSKLFISPVRFTTIPTKVLFAMLNCFATVLPAKRAAKLPQYARDLIFFVYWSFRSVTQFPAFYMELLSGGVLVTNNIMSDFLTKSEGLKLYLPSLQKSCSQCLTGFLPCCLLSGQPNLPQLNALSLWRFIPSGYSSISYVNRMAILDIDCFNWVIPIPTGYYFDKRFNFLILSSDGWVSDTINSSELRDV